MQTIIGDLQAEIDKLTATSVGRCQRLAERDLENRQLRERLAARDARIAALEAELAELAESRAEAENMNGRLVFLADKWMQSENNFQRQLLVSNRLRQQLQGEVDRDT